METMAEETDSRPQNGSDAGSRRASLAHLYLSPSLTLKPFLFVLRLSMVAAGLILALASNSSSPDDQVAAQQVGSVATDRAALVALYDATDGANWTDNTNWKTSAALSTWFGVTTDSNGRVTKVKMANNLVGTLPSELGNLSELTRLELDGNKLHGAIPSELGNLSKLERLSLGFNSLSGSIPSQLGNLSQLQSLVLVVNSLTGSIPSQLGNLSQLQALGLGFNRLSGPIPSQLGNLSQLQALDLQANYLSGSIPSQLGNLSQLESLQLFRNSLSGSIPSQLGSLSNLTKLWLGYNSLTGNIPSEIGNLSQLTELRLGGNNFTSGSVPSWITSTNFPSLRDLRLERANRTGTMPSALGNLSNLRVLHLSFNNFDSGSVPSWINNTNFPNLVHLHLFSTNRTGSIPTAIGDLSNLQVLQLGGNQLSGSIPSDLGDLSGLRALRLNQNNLSGSIPSQLGNLSNLQFLDMSGNSLSGSIPTQLGSLSNLIGLRLQSNDFSGTIPSEIKNLSNLQVLRLSDNDFTSGAVPSWITSTNFPNLKDLRLDGTNRTGTMPSALGNLSNLEVLDLGWNGFDSGAIPSWINSTNFPNLTWLTIGNTNRTGTMPSALGNFSKLQHLYLGENDFDSGAIPSWINSTNFPNMLWLHLNNTNRTGSIPSALGGLSNLIELNLERNQLSGSIPSQLGNLSKLQLLNLDQNQLSGSIPSQLGNLTNLTELRLFDNNLSGSLPSQLGNLTRLRVFDLAFNSLTGSLPSSFANLTNLRFFSVQDNLMSGALPSWFGSFSNLSTLSISDNAFTGTIPTSIGLLRRLGVLGLGDNNFDDGPVPAWVNSANFPDLWWLNLRNINRTGTIPSYIGNISDLTRLELGDNNFDSGVFPTWLTSTNLPNLLTLDLAGTNRTGTIPNLSGFSEMRSLKLNDNGLSGSIPSQLGDLTTLTRLHLHNNQLTGAVPLEVRSLTALTHLRLDGNAGLCSPASLQQWLAHRDNLIALCTQGTRVPGEDFNSLLAAGNLLPSGMWSDGTTMWVSDSDTDQLHAYKMSDKTRDSSKDFSSLDASNAHPRGIWSDGTTMWVADSIGNKLYAYKMSDKSRDSSKDFSVSHAVSNDRAEGLWSDGATMWVADLADDKLYAYKVSDQTRDSSKDFNLVAGNSGPRGLWSDGTTMWVADPGVNRIYAYKMSDKSRDSSRDFNTLDAAGNHELWGIWSDGKTMWATDWDDDKIYAYNHVDPAPVVPDFPLERATLAVLFDRTDGANWSRKTNWKSDLPLGDWQGVTTDSSGRVSVLDLAGNGLSGSLPGELTALSNLITLRVGNNSGLCIPDGLFQGWLASRLRDRDSRGVTLCTTTVPTGDRAVLEALYDATGGAGWNNKANWGSNKPLNTWYGVKTNADGRVVELNLDNNNLTGSLPSEIGELIRLENLWMRRNDLSGLIPDELENLRGTLVSLDLSDNSLSGEIPAELGRLRKLEELYLNGNRLSGYVPSDLGRLGKYGVLEDLDLQFNSGLYGAIPEGLSYAGRGVEVKNVYVNDTGMCLPAGLEGWWQNWRQGVRGGLERSGPKWPDQISTCGSQRQPVPPPGQTPIVHQGDRDALKALYDATDGDGWKKNTNWGSDAPLNSWSGVTTDEDGRVTELKLRRRGLKGHIPTELGNLAKLRHLDLSYNSLKNSDTGVNLPSSLGNLTKLTKLYLNGNLVSGRIPTWLSTLPINRTGLRLEGNTNLCAPLSLRAWLIDRSNYIDICEENPRDNLSQQSSALAAEFAPILRMHPEETVFPRSVESMIDNAWLYDFRDRLVRSNPTAQYLGQSLNLYGHYYLDLRTSSGIDIPAPYWIDDRNSDDPYVTYRAADDALIEEVYKRNIYTRVAIQDKILGLQYWFFYPLDRNHEGDWEMIQLNFEFDDSISVSDDDLQGIAYLIATILEHDITPKRLIYSSHAFINAECWHGSSKFQRHGFNPFVFPARGSHANYFEAGEHSLLPGSGFFGYHDRTSLFGPALVPQGFSGQLSEFGASVKQEYDIDLLDERQSDPPWLNFRGKWGDQTDRNHGDGPDGPKFSPRWSDLRFGESHTAFKCKNSTRVISFDGEQAVADKNGTVKTFRRSNVHYLLTEELASDAFGAVDPGLGMSLRESDLDVGTSSSSGVFAQAVGESGAEVVPASNNPDFVTLDFSYDAVAALEPGWEVVIEEIDAGDLTRPGVSKLRDSVRGSRNEEVLALVDISISDDLRRRDVTVCISAPFGFPGDREIRHYDEESEDWDVLETFVGSYEHISCAVTDAFSLFAVVGDRSKIDGSSVVPLAKRASRIEPVIVGGVTLSGSDSVRLSTNVFGQQDILDNDLAEGMTFEWSLDGVAIEGVGSGREIEFVAPSDPGLYTVTASLSEYYCNGSYGTCTAEFKIAVRRSSAVPEDRPVPEDPIGGIPTVLVDAEGRQYDVFTPEGGGHFDGDSVTLSAGPGVVPNLDIVGVRADTAGSASNIGQVHHRYTLGGFWHEVRAVDVDGDPVSAYSLQSPLEVCVPLPPELSSNISDVTLVSMNAGSSFTVHSSMVRITTSGTQVCGGLSTLPATIAVGRLGSPAGLPTPTPTADEAEIPDTGGYSPIDSRGVIFLLILGAALAMMGYALIYSAIRRNSKRE